MPSLKFVSLGSFALLASTVLGGTPDTCSTTGPFSCQNTTVQTNTCCFNAPGGSLLQTQFWDTAPATGPTNSWTVHGLWPDHCDGTFDSNCDASRAYTNITQILQAFGKTELLSFMDTFWKDEGGDDESFWEHEWAKHGTCISTLKPDCYVDYTPTQEVPDFFQRVVDLFQTLDTFTFLSNAGIVPSSTKTYSLASIQAALKAAVGVDVIVQCSGSAGNELDEAWYYYHVAGSVQTGNFQHANPDTGTSGCPATVKYLPKSAGSPAPTGTPAPGSPTPTSPAPVGPTTPPATGSFSGPGFLNVAEGGSQNGCLISAGVWFTSGTCATYTATASGSGFTLTSSKGKCAMSAGTFTCSSSVTTATVFGSSGGLLTFGGSSAFHSNAVASGQTQEPVMSGTGSVNLQISFEST